MNEEITAQFLKMLDLAFKELYFINKRLSLIDSRLSLLDKRLEKLTGESYE